MDTSMTLPAEAQGLPPAIPSLTPSAAVTRTPQDAPRAPPSIAEWVDPFPDDPYCSNSLPPYTFDPALSADDNLMVHTLIYARLSISKRGNMAALVVGPSLSPPAAAVDGSEAALAPQPTILVHSNNTPLPSPSILPHQKHPELHAEARCISLAARRGISLAGSTIYVSFPPCGACLQLIVGAGISRAVYRRRLLGEESVAFAKEEGMELVEVTEFGKDEDLKKRAGDWWTEHGETKERAKARSERWWRSKGPAYGSQIAAVEGAEGDGGAGGKKGKKQKGEKRKRE